jgi:phosphoacetylglucosamine mutase
MEQSFLVRRLLLPLNPQKGNNLTYYFRSNEKQSAALQILSAFSDLINQTVGDALSDMLMVEAILASSDQTFSEWNSSYTDLPSRQKKVKVCVVFIIGV